MADELEIKTPHPNPWRAREMGALIGEPFEAPLWDKLLAELRLTEPEALEAIFGEGDAGRSIRRFAQNFCRDHFVPEKVLQAMDLD